MRVIVTRRLLLIGRQRVVLLLLGQWLGWRQGTECQRCASQRAMSRCESAATFQHQRIVPAQFRVVQASSPAIAAPSVLAVLAFQANMAVIVLPVTGQQLVSQALGIVNRQADPGETLQPAPHQVQFLPVCCAAVRPCPAVGV